MYFDGVHADALSQNLSIPSRRVASAVMFCEQPLRGLPTYPASIREAYRLIRLQPYTPYPISFCCICSPYSSVECNMFLAEDTPQKTTRFQSPRHTHGGFHTLQRWLAGVSMSGLLVHGWQVGDQSACVLAVRHLAGNQQLQVFVAHPDRPILLIRSFAIKKTIRAWHFYSA